jgi:hypothetical protein
VQPQPGGSRYYVSNGRRLIPPYGASGLSRTIPRNASFPADKPRSLQDWVILQFPDFFENEVSLASVERHRL